MVVSAMQWSFRLAAPNTLQRGRRAPEAWALTSPASAFYTSSSPCLLHLRMLCRACAVVVLDIALTDLEALLACTVNKPSPLLFHLLLLQLLLRISFRAYLPSVIPC